MSEPEATPQMGNGGSKPRRETLQMEGGPQAWDCPLCSPPTDWEHPRGANDQPCASILIVIILTSNRRALPCFRELKFIFFNRLYIYMNQNLKICGRFLVKSFLSSLPQPTLPTGFRQP